MADYNPDEEIINISRGWGRKEFRGDYIRDRIYIQYPLPLAVVVERLQEIAANDTLHGATVSLENHRDTSAELMVTGWRQATREELAERDKYIADKASHDQRMSDKALAKRRQQYEELKREFG